MHYEKSDKRSFYICSSRGMYNIYSGSYFVLFLVNSSLICVKSSHQLIPSISFSLLMKFRVGVCFCMIYITRNVYRSEGFTAAKILIFEWKFQIRIWIILHDTNSLQNAKDFVSAVVRFCCSENRFPTILFSSNVAFCLHLPFLPGCHSIQTLIREMQMN